MSINSVVLVGRLARDVEFKTLPSGTGVVNNAIAVNHWRKDQNGQAQEYASFIDVSFFGRTAEVVNQYLRKGSQIGITGRLEQQSWKDAQSGQNRSKLVVIVDQMQMLDSKPTGESNSSYGRNSQQGGGFESSAPSYSNSYAKPSYSNNFGNKSEFDSSMDDELPF